MTATTALFTLIAFGFIAWFWLDSLRAREIATAITKELCRRQNLQFLDGTVAMAGLGLRRNKQGRLQLRRTYRFEFTTNGADRRKGHLVMIGRQMELINLELPASELPGQMRPETVSGFAPRPMPKIGK